MIKIQEVNIFLESQYSLTKISIDVYVSKISIYVRPMNLALIIFCHDPKIRCDGTCIIPSRQVSLTPNNHNKVRK